jgi:hypothetical protein
MSTDSQSTTIGKPTATMDADARLLSMVAAVDEALAALADMQAALQKGRLELAFSRMQFGGAALVGGSMLYVPSEMVPSTGVALAAGPTALRFSVQADPSALPAKPRAASDESGGALDDALLARLGAGLRHRAGHTTAGVGAAGAVGHASGVAVSGSAPPEAPITETGAAAEGGNGPTVAAAGAGPLAWFGPNASPSIPKAQLHFKAALQAATRLATLRAALEASIDRPGLEAPAAGASASTRGGVTSAADA